MNSLCCECCGNTHNLKITWERFRELRELDRLGYVSTADCKATRRRIRDGYCKVVFEDENHLVYIHTDDIKPQSLLQYFLNWADKTLTSN